jgi:hypothetical protein
MFIIRQSVYYTAKRILYGKAYIIRQSVCYTAKRILYGKAYIIRQSVYHTAKRISPLQVFPESKHSIHPPKTVLQTALVESKSLVTEGQLRLTERSLYCCRDKCWYILLSWDVVRQDLMSVASVLGASSERTEHRIFSYLAIYACLTASSVIFVVSCVSLVHGNGYRCILRSLFTNSPQRHRNIFEPSRRECVQSVEYCYMYHKLCVCDLQRGLSSTIEEPMNVFSTPSEERFCAVSPSTRPWHRNSVHLL